MAPDPKELSNMLQSEAEDGVHWERQWETEKASGECNKEKVALWPPPHTVPQLEKKPDTLS